MTTMRMGVSKGVTTTKVSSVFYSKAINPENTDDISREEADKTQAEEKEQASRQNSLFGGGEF